MNKLPLIVRLLLGAIFVVFGLNGFFHFLPQPPLPEAALGFVGGLAGSGYFFPFLKGVEVIAGLALLTGYFVPLAVVVLAPVAINIFLFHAFLAPAGMVLPIVIAVLEVYLLLFAKPYSNVPRQLLRAKDE